METIPLLKPSYSGKELEYVEKVLKSGWWGQGKVTEEFEQKLADMYNYKYCVAVNSCTAALHLALLANGIGPGDKVAVPALTFISTALAVTYCGAEPVFKDIDPATLCMVKGDQDELSGNIFVDYAGYPAFDSATDASAYKEKVLVQDAAHSAGGISWGNEICLSFHPVKNLATGDGGAILTNSETIANKAKALRWCGINKSTYDRTKARYGWDYDIQEVGYKCHWNDIQAAIGLAQLERLDELNEKRAIIAYRYNKAFTPYNNRLLVVPPCHNLHTWHLYTIQVNPLIRNHLIRFLTQNGISAGVHYKPLTHYPMYENVVLPYTDNIWMRLVSLPIFADLTSDEQRYIIKKVLEFLSEEPDYKTKITEIKSGSLTNYYKEDLEEEYESNDGSNSCNR